jgi:hypothetical protein
MLQIDERIEIEQDTDEPVPCTPYALECGQPAVFWHVYSCCGKKFPFCIPHSTQADREAGWYNYCSICMTPCDEATYIKIPIGSS